MVEVGRGLKDHLVLILREQSLNKQFPLMLLLCLLLSEGATTSHDLITVQL